jgi:NAD(P)-dependent dehydrogenase (short-subunit alcohol dehydrogenase family)
VREFAGRVAVVTGGASGIGLGLARRFAAEGMKVVIGDVEAPALDAALDVLKADGADVHGVITDVSDAEQVDALADATLERFGAVHLVCNNAGVGGGGLSWEMPLSTWEWVLGVNLWGVVHGIRTFVPLLLQQDEGYVVNTASLAGLVAGPFMAPYNASKHAVVAMSETLHHELALMGAKVGVSVLCPGWVDTRIADAARNRPASLTPEGESAGLGADFLKTVLAQGMPPAEVADKVLAAINDEQFWVLPHDDQDPRWVDVVDRHLQSLRERTNPTHQFNQMLQGNSPPQSS